MVEALRDKGADIFQDAGKNPSTAVLLYYINSGCLKFQEWKEYDAMQDGQEYDIEALCQEIRNEQLLEMEIASLIEQWEKDHSYVQQNFFACGACGVRQMDNPRVVYRPLMLSSPEAEPLCYRSNEQEIKEFLALVQSTKNVQIPLSEYQSGSIDISKVKSVFSADGGFSNLFHLHPE